MTRASGAFHGVMVISAARALLGASSVCLADDAVPQAVQRQTDAWKTVEQITGDIANIYGTGQAAVAVLQTFAQAVGIVSDSQDAIQQSLAALSAQIDAVGGALSWQFSAQDREDRLADLVGDVLTAGQTVALGQPFTENSPAASDSQNKAQEAAAETAFLRLFVESATNGSTTSDFSWKSIISDRPEVNNDLVYDWRLGVPAFLQVLSLRLQVIAALDPNFEVDGVFTAEFASHVAALQAQLDRLNGAVRCNVVSVEPSYDGNTWSPDPYVHFLLGCADIYTGISDTQEILIPAGTYPVDVSACLIDVNVAGPFNYDQSCLDRRDVDYPIWYQTNIQPLLSTAQQTVLDQLPIGAVASMISLFQGFMSSSAGS